MKALFSLLSGLLFGLGLIVAGMTNPAKVQNFLDPFGTWDPSLLFVMGFAIAVTLPGFYLAGNRAQPLFHGQFHLPTKRDLDPQLIGGAAIFGIGWGMGGLCPGPALTVLPTGASGIIVFVIALCAGLIGVNLWRHRQARRLALT